MIKAIRHLTKRDRLALAAFFGIVLLCTVYFASGILVTYVSPAGDGFEAAPEGTGYTVRVYGLQTYSAADQLKTAIKEQRQILAEIEADPADLSYLVNIGPLLKRTAAETLINELQTSGYNLAKIIDNCPQGADCPPVASSPKPSQRNPDK
ncbi:MAG: SPOR domain-containing protein [Acidobacteria bacterium]|nr:SPOR domain-containing protein [Acidobacteriota bacterium]